MIFVRIAAVGKLERCLDERLEERLLYSKSYREESLCSYLQRAASLREHIQKSSYLNICTEQLT